MIFWDCKASTMDSEGRSPATWCCAQSPTFTIARSSIHLKMILMKDPPHGCLSVLLNNCKYLSSVARVAVCEPDLLVFAIGMELIVICCFFLGQYVCERQDDLLLSCRHDAYECKHVLLWFCCKYAGWSQCDLLILVYVCMCVSIRFSMICRWCTCEY